MGEDQDGRERKERPKISRREGGGEERKSSDENISPFFMFIFFQLIFLFLVMLWQHCSISQANKVTLN